MMMNRLASIECTCSCAIGGWYCVASQSPTLSAMMWRWCFGSVDVDPVPLWSVRGWWCLWGGEAMNFGALWSDRPATR